MKALVITGSGRTSFAKKIRFAARKKLKIKKAIIIEYKSGESLSYDQIRDLMNKMDGCKKNVKIWKAKL